MLVTVDRSVLHRLHVVQRRLSAVLQFPPQPVSLPLPLSLLLCPPPATAPPPHRPLPSAHPKSQLPLPPPSATEQLILQNYAQHTHQLKGFVGRFKELF